MTTTLLPRPALRFAIHEDGSWEVISPWFPIVLFAPDVLARADGRRLIVQGEDIELRCTNGGARYRLTSMRLDGARLCRLMRSW